MMIWKKTKHKHVPWKFNHGIRLIWDSIEMWLNIAKTKRRGKKHDTQCSYTNSQGGAIYIYGKWMCVSLILCRKDTQKKYSNYKLRFIPVGAHFIYYLICFLRKMLPKTLWKPFDFCCCSFFNGKMSVYLPFE